MDHTIANTDSEMDQHISRHKQNQMHYDIARQQQQSNRDGPQHCGTIPNIKRKHNKQAMKSRWSTAWPNTTNNHIQIGHNMARRHTRIKQMNRKFRKRSPPLLVYLTIRVGKCHHHSIGHVTSFSSIHWYWNSSLARMFYDYVSLLICCLSCLLACLLACLPACLLACLPACLPACRPACLPACLLACLPFCLRAYVFV